MKNCILFLLISSGLFATVNEPLRAEWFSGYRNDRIHWHLQEAGDDATLTYSELYRDVEYWENGLTFKAIYRDLTFFLRGAYGAFGRGSVRQRIADLPFTTEEPHFHFRTDGWTADGMGYFGYAVNLTADRIYKVILTPLFGFSGYFEQLSRRDASPNPLVSDSFTMRSQLPKKFRLVWYGLFLGTGLTIQPGGRFVFDFGYTYHWLHTALHDRVKTETVLAPGTEFVNEFTVKAKSGGNMGHTGWAQIDYLISCLWRFGFGADIHYFSSKEIDVLDDQKLKLRWTSVSGWAQISREF